MTYHATRTSYDNGCRCGTCVEASGTFINTREHGTRMGYGQGCRCSDCRRANTAYERARRSGEPIEVRVPLPVPDCKKSEAAIERERHKRRVEKEIEMSLRPEPVVRSEAAFKPVSIAKFMRAPRGGGNGWSCPTGCASN